MTIRSAYVGYEVVAYWRSLIFERTADAFGLSALKQPHI